MLSLGMAAAGLLAAPAWAGPPLICQKIETGNAKSLPWKDGPNWNGVDASYPLGRLLPDTLALLAPDTPVAVRMETMRRAAIYAARSTKLAAEMTARLTARVLDAEAAGKSEPMAWFDAGYWVETLRQATFIYRYDMLPAAEKQAWALRQRTPGLDGYAWVKKAIRLGGKDMDVALARMTDYRNADLRADAR
jgi:hypothetical protein